MVFPLFLVSDECRISVGFNNHVSSCVKAVEIDGLAIKSAAYSVLKTVMPLNGTVIIAIEINTDVFKSNSILHLDQCVCALDH